MSLSTAQRDDFFAELASQNEFGHWGAVEQPDGTARRVASSQTRRDHGETLGCAQTLLSKSRRAGVAAAGVVALIAVGMSIVVFAPSAPDGRSARPSGRSAPAAFSAARVRANERLAYAARARRIAPVRAIERSLRSTRRARRKREIEARRSKRTPPRPASSDPPPMTSTASAPTTAATAPASPTPAPATAPSSAPAAAAPDTTCTEFPPC